MKKVLAFLVFLLAPGWAFAEAELRRCGGPAQVGAIVEPWSKGTRTFAQGAIRLVLLDTAEPACCAVHLAILAPDPQDEMGLRQCLTLSDGGEWTGFQSIDLQGVQSSYDAGRGLLLRIPVERYVDGLRSNHDAVAIRINQATGAVTFE